MKRRGFIAALTGIAGVLGLGLVKAGPKGDKGDMGIPGVPGNVGPCGDTVTFNNASARVISLPRQNVGDRTTIVKTGVNPDRWTIYHDSCNAENATLSIGIAKPNEPHA